MTDDRAKLYDLIDANPTCMMTTIDEKGLPHARPMHAIVERETGAIWMYTELASGKSRELAQDGHVCLAFARPSKSDYVSVTGAASVTQDRDRIHKYWNKFVQAWFSEGPDGANVALIKVEPVAGEYWDASSSKVVNAVKQLAASQSEGKPDMGDHGKVGTL